MYFEGLSKPSDIKAKYRKLALENHPDMGGETRIMQEINAAYLIALQAIDGTTTVVRDTETGKDVEYVYNYRQDTEQAVIDIIDQLLKLKMVDVDVYIVGVWVWVSGNTKPYKEELKGLKLRWHSKRLKWYFKPYRGRTHYSNKSFDTLLNQYGGGRIPSYVETVIE
jgi:hypothetical protein